MKRYKYLHDIICKRYDIEDKDKCVNQFILYMFNRLQSMFQWEGLPETVPQRCLELYLQYYGHCCFTEYQDDLYVFYGGLGGEPDVYYMPTIYTVANPALNYSANLKINEDCVVIPNDSMYVGLYPILSRYAQQLTETELSIYIATINSRIVDLISAPDDRTRASAELYLEKVKAGKLGVMTENAFLDGIRAQPYGNTGNSNNITNLIELLQYQKASWFHEMGLDANFNMKRESLNSTESQLNNDALLPLIDDMLNCRRIAAEKINEKYGLNIEVSYSSSWEDNEKEIELELEEKEQAEPDPAEPEQAGPEEPEESEDQDDERTEET